jgi:hypothetical protein
MITLNETSLNKKLNQNPLKTSSGNKEFQCVEKAVRVFDLNKLFERVVFAHCVHEHAAFFLSL